MLWSSSPTTQTFCCCAGEQLHQLVLRAVGVLVFVDEQIVVAAVVALAHFAGGLEQAHGFEQQIVEVERVGFAQLLVDRSRRCARRFSLVGSVEARKYSCGSIMWFFAQEIVQSTTRGLSCLSSRPMRRIDGCLTTACWSVSS